MHPHNRARTVISKEDRKSEVEYVEKALTNCRYPGWLLKRGAVHPKQREDTPDPPSKEDQVPGFSLHKEAVKGLYRTFKALWIGTYFKPRNTIRKLLVSLKDQLKKEKCRVVYLINCDDGERRKTSVRAPTLGKQLRTLKTSAAEHQQFSSTSSEVSQYHHLPGRHHHHIFHSSIKILDSDPGWH